MTWFPLARSVTNRRADGGLSDSPLIKITFVNKLPRTMADVCEAFRFFRAFSGLITNIRVHSWFSKKISHPI